jgi:hypothetical protein
MLLLCDRSPLGIVKPLQVNGERSVPFNFQHFNHLTLGRFWKHYPNCGAFAKLALRFDAATMQLCDVLHNRQSQTGASQFATPSFVSPIKALEDPWQMLFADPKPMIGHAEHGVGVPTRRS